MADRLQIDEIKEKLDIVDVAHGYISAPFRQTGRNTFTLCPFHSEKSPSFSLNSDLGIYKCFGCGESGDVIKFIEKLEGVDFAQALEIAAKKAGVTLKNDLSPKDIQRNEMRKRIISANETAAEYFHFLFMKHKSGAEARNYVRKRKLEKREVVKFKIGFAPDGFENLKNFMIKKGFKLPELVEFGLLVSKNGKIYDKFRNRLMFPIVNHRGETVGFSGRTLEKDGIPKYLNSPETLVYKKSEILYGLFQAKESIRKTGFAIIAEGNVEPLSSGKLDIDNVVVPMGTSLTSGQLKLLKRYANTIYLAFDSDSAGQTALIRSFQIAQQNEFNVKVINMGKYKDPDEMITDNPTSWQVAVNNAIDFVEYIINSFAEKFDISSGTGKSEYVNTLKPFINSTKNSIQKEHYSNLIADKINLSKNSVLNSLEDSTQHFPKSNEMQENVNTERISKEQYLVALKLAFGDNKVDLTGINFTKKIKTILDVYEKQRDLKKVRSELSDDLKNLFDTIVNVNISHVENEHMALDLMKKIINNLRIDDIKQEISILKSQIKQKESTGADITEELSKVEKLTKEIQRL